MMNWLRLLFGAPRVTKSWELGSGYDHEKWKMKTLKEYKDACKAAVADPKLEAENLDDDPELETKCNFGVQQICAKMGYKVFDKKRANAIHSLLVVDPEWIRATGDVCAAKVKEGGFIAIASHESKTGSGHVAMVYPGDLGSSGKWKSQKVPLVAHVGKKGTNRIKFANYAFGEEPAYFYRSIE